jgi:hypothetical protein
MPRSDRSKTRNSARAIRARPTGDFHNKIGQQKTFPRHRGNKKVEGIAVLSMAPACRFRSRLEERSLIETQSGSPASCSASDNGVARGGGIPNPAQKPPTVKLGWSASTFAAAAFA